VSPQRTMRSKTKPGGFSTCLPSSDSWSPVPLIFLKGINMLIFVADLLLALPRQFARRESEGLNESPAVRLGQRNEILIQCYVSSI
jgi:hypothetical protein